MLRLRQICLVAPDLTKPVAQLESVLGLKTCFHDPGVEKYGLNNALLPIGNNFLEVVAPFREGTAAEREAWALRLIPQSERPDRGLASNADFAEARQHGWGRGDPAQAWDALPAQARGTLGNARLKFLPRPKFAALTAPGPSGERPEHLE